MWIDYHIILGLNEEKEMKYVEALLLNKFGPDGLDVYNDMNLPEERKMNDILKSFDEHFGVKTRKTFERFKFNKRNREENETI